MKKEDIFNKIVSENNERIHRICRYYVNNDKDRKDLYQEVLINIWNSIDNFKGDSNINTYIYRVAVNTSLTFKNKSFSSLPYNISIIEFQFFYWGLIILAAIVELVLWYIKYKPIRDNLLRLIDEM